MKPLKSQVPYTCNLNRGSSSLTRRPEVESTLEAPWPTCLSKVMSSRLGEKRPFQKLIGRVEETAQSLEGMFCKHRAEDRAQNSGDNKKAEHSCTGPQPLVQRLQLAAGQQA